LPIKYKIPKETRHAIEALAAQAGGAITRIRAEQSMRTSRQLLEKTIQSLRAAVFIVDARTITIRECNPAATRLFGHSREEIIGQSPGLLHLNETMREEFGRHMAAAVKEKGLLSDFEFTMKRKDGTSFPSELTIVPIRNEQGQILAWVAVVRDITERKRTEEGLRELSRHIIEAQEAERQRVARDLHDSVNQVIASAKMRLRKVEASVALKESPGELIFDPTDCPSLTVSVVPAGTTTGCGAGALVSAEEPVAFPPAAFDGAAVLLAELEAVSAGLLEQATSVNHRKMENTYSARERMIFTSEVKVC